MVIPPLPIIVGLRRGVVKCPLLYCRSPKRLFELSMNIEQELKALEALLPNTRTKDRYFLERDFKRLQGEDRRKGVTHDALRKLKERIVRSASEVAERLASIPKELNYDTSLPVVEERERLLQLIKNHQVVIVCGETGSGKTTQLGKICMELGLGARGVIGHTQPRRIAARSVAARIAEELKSPLGGLVGYKMRFNDRTDERGILKLMTDGILLTELARDRYLNQYEVIIIDEAHERSLNIDFLLGILKKILPRRPDLKLIITSATIDTERFSNYFGGEKNAPIIEVSGRTYPVEIRYRPLAVSEEEQGELDAISQGIIDALYELKREGPGDTLIFLSGEREIREVADLLREHFRNEYEILPLFSRLSQQEQNRIFSKSRGNRIVLSTNVAETSLTVPGIKYVIDPGFARVSRYSARSRMQSLLVEPIAQAAANQRAGRCGRVSEGIAIRLYSEEDFLTRDEFLDPEILRTHLASVILQMGYLRLGHPERFPFIEPPESQQIREGFRTLRELRAVRHNGSLTQLGRKLARLPIDPRFGAMLLAGVERGVTHELLVLVAILSIQDPRERPLEKQQQADQAHSHFKNERSDYISYLNLWGWYQTVAKESSQRELRQLCRRYFLNFMRMREWYELYQQLLKIIKEAKLPLNPFPKSNREGSADRVVFPKFKEDQIHQAIVTGLLDQIGMLGEEYLYSGSNNRKFRIFPGSSLFKKPPKWIMALEIVETSQVYARTCAAINPQWLEEIASHLIRKSYTEPHWSKNQGQAAAYETLSLFGLTIISRRLVSFGKVEPKLSRELMIREGLVGGEINIRASFYRENLKTIEGVQLMEEKTRRRDILIEEWKLFEWYDARIPHDCYSVATLEHWAKKRENNHSLIFTEEEILARDENLNLEDFPEQITLNNLTLNALYLFDPSDERDGMTLLVPLAALNLLEKNRLDWLVQGLIEEKITEIIRTLPRSLRRNFVPLPDVVEELLSELTFGEGNLYYQISTFLTRRSGITIEPHHFDEAKLDKHLLMNLRVIDSGGKTLAEGRDLQQLQRQFKGRAENAFQALANLKEVIKPTKKQNLSQKKRSDSASKGAPTIPIEKPLDPNSWAIPEQLTFTRNGITLEGYPALLLEEGELYQRLYDRKATARERHLQTLVALSLQALNEQVKYLRRQWPNFGKLALLFKQVGSEEALKEDLMRAVIGDHFDLEKLPRTSEQLKHLVEELRRNIVANATELSRLIVEIFALYKEVRETLNKLHPMNRALIEPLITEHYNRLIYLNFISNTPKEWRQHLPRYFEAMAIRVERFPQNIKRDREHHELISRHLKQWKEADRFYREREEYEPQVLYYRWLIEELAVSLFAQPMKTAESVSPKRLKRLWAEIDLEIKNSR